MEWNCDREPYLIYLIRTSYLDADSFHNSNRITYKTLKNYRQRIQQHEQTMLEKDLIR